MIGLPDRITGLLFDLDGVLTSTAVLHRAAWRETFDAFLANREGPGFAPFTDRDYAEYVDGKPRADGVRSFLTSRGIELPEGTPDDPPTAPTVNGVGNRKNELLLKVIDEQGVSPYPGSVQYLQAAREAGLKIGVVTSSANGAAVLDAAGLSPFVQARVDGVVIARDADRKAIVTATDGGSVAAVRVARPAAFKLGVRVRAKGTKRWDGTLRATSVKRRGLAVAAKARVVVVRRAGSSLLVSAGDSLFTLSAGVSQVSRPGAVVDARLRTTKGKVAVVKAKEVGQASTVVLTGLFDSLTDNVLRLTNGLSVATPEAFALFKQRRDEVLLLVTVGPDGSFALVASDLESEAAGTVMAVSAESMTVGGVTCAVPEDVDVTDVVVGDLAFLSCSLVDGKLVADGYELEPAGFEEGPWEEELY